jgi:hypothetical protein
MHVYSMHLGMLLGATAVDKIHIQLPSNYFESSPGI